MREQTSCSVRVSALKQSYHRPKRFMTLRCRGLCNSTLLFVAFLFLLAGQAYCDETVKHTKPVLANDRHVHNHIINVQLESAHVYDGRHFRKLLDGDPTSQPSAQPSRHPTSQPSDQPTDQPTSRPTGQPTVQPSAHPSMQPVAQPSAQPTTQPSCRPSSQPYGRVVRVRWIQTSPQASRRC